MRSVKIVSGSAARHLVLHYTDNVRTLDVVDVDMDITVEVFGDPENGAYEWLIRDHGTIVKHSDAGYGRRAAALRDGLNTYFDDEGVPTTQLFAKIKRSSKYAYQHDGKEPFPVSVFDTRDAYRIHGNGGHYRIEDLTFFVRAADQFVKLG